VDIVADFLVTLYLKSVDPRKFNIFLSISDEEFFRMEYIILGLPKCGIFHPVLDIKRFTIRIQVDKLLVTQNGSQTALAEI